MAKILVKERKALIERNEDNPDMLIILQHHPLYTLRTRTHGGKVTYHGSGQVFRVAFQNCHIPRNLMAVNNIEKQVIFVINKRQII